MSVSSRLALSVAALLALSTAKAAADPILAAPGDPAFDPALEALASGYQRQQDLFATLENGLSLDAIFLPGEVQTVRDFFAQTGTDDFQQFSGKHPYTAMIAFDEHGDEGNFAGVASVGVAARLIALKAQGAPAAEIARARDAAVRAAQAWHVYGAIGGPGVVARGVRRVTPWNAGDPPFPGTTPTLIPLVDGGGNPLPVEKAAVWRAPVAPGFDGWIWFDDTSKDQVCGYALAVAWLWDALHDDPLVPSEVSSAIAADLAVFAKALMQVAPELGIDLVIRDADGRLTSHNDINSRQLGPGGVLPESVSLRNGFNAAMALAIIRAAYHVSGDEEIGKYYYEELVGHRDYPTQATTNAGALFVGAATNYSNANMLAVSLAALGRFETDEYALKQLDATLYGQFWSVGSDRDVSHVEQAWFDSIYGAYGSPAPLSIRTRVPKHLSGFQPAPAFGRDRMNCDDAEIAAGSCLAIDGTTSIALMPTPGHGGGPVAKDIVPMSLRPDSDFAWRSDPHEVNGGLTTILNPGGDFLAAYWLARVTDLDERYKNRSPFARPPLPYVLGDGGVTGGTGGAGGSGGGAGAKEPPSSGGCSACTSAGAPRGPDLGGAAGLVAAALMALRRTRSSRWIPSGCRSRSRTSCRTRSATRRREAA